jgi:hypothetical protein
MIAFPNVSGAQVPAEVEVSTETDPPMMAFPNVPGSREPAATDILAEVSTPTTLPPAGTEPAELEEMGDEIARLSAHLHAATYRLLVLIRAFDERGGWGGGFRSCGHWLSWRTGIAPGAAREKVRVARALGSLPRISEGMARGELSYSKELGPYCASLR